MMIMIITITSHILYLLTAQVRRTGFHNTVNSLYTVDIGLPHFDKL